MKKLCFCLAILGGASSSHAQTLVLGVGYADFSHDQSVDQGLISLEYQLKPFHQFQRLGFGWTTALTVHEDGDLHAGVGLYGILPLGRQWFVESSIMPGFYSESDPSNDLGGNFQIRSLLALGYRFENDNRLSFAITHRSNASTHNFNPGVNAAILRFHRSF